LWIDCLSLDVERKKDDGLLSLSTSGVYSALSDSSVSQLPLSSVDPLQNMYERSSAEQHLLSSAVSEREPELSFSEHISALSHDSRANCEPSLSPFNVSDDLLNCNKALPKLAYLEALDPGKDWMTNAQSVSVNSCSHKSDESVVDMSSVISDSGVDSCTVSSSVCVSDLSTADADSSCVLPEISTQPKKAFHSRSASDGGIFKPRQHFPNLPPGNDKQGTELFGKVFFVKICLVKITCFINCQFFARFKLLQGNCSGGSVV